MSYRFADSLLSANLYDMPLLCVQWKTPDDGQRKCPKHVEFYSKNKFEKLVHLVGFIIRIYHDARSPECQTVMSEEEEEEEEDEKEEEEDCLLLNSNMWWDTKRKFSAKNEL